MGEGGALEEAETLSEVVPQEERVGLSEGLPEEVDVRHCDEVALTDAETEGEVVGEKVAEAVRHSVGLVEGLAVTDKVVDEEWVRVSVPLPLPQALRVEVRDGLPLADSVPEREAQADGDLVTLLVAETQPECVGEPRAEVVMEPEPVRLCEEVALVLTEGEDVALMLPVPDGQ